MDVIAVFFMLLVVFGFAFHMAASFGVAWATKAAWGCWFVASILWAIGKTGTGGHA